MDPPERADAGSQHQGWGASEEDSTQQEVCRRTESKADGRKLDTCRPEQTSHPMDARSYPRIQAWSVQAPVLSGRGGIQPTQSPLIAGK